MDQRRWLFILTLGLSMAGILVGYMLMARQVTADPIPAEAWESTMEISSTQADSAAPPSTPVKLIFIHHSCGGHWLADIGEHDMAGGLGQALMNNNYFVSATNYGWGPGEIGSETNIPNWPQWFTDTVMSQVYTESDQNICNPVTSEDCFGNWSRLASDPGGENEIIMFKPCFPNSDLYGETTDTPNPGETPNSDMTIRNAKAVYNYILNNYFVNNQNKLFIAVTAPPMAEASYVDNDISTPAADRAANARAFNDWLVNEWLASYEYDNVAVFDFYNVLTSNGSPTYIDDTSVNTEPHDLSRQPEGNHHYWNGSEIVHPQTVNNNFSAYPYYSVEPTAPDLWCDNHPTGPGNIKATAEFVPLLNVYYNRWKGGGAPAQPKLSLTQPKGGETWQTESQYQIKWTTTGTVAQVNLSYSTDGFTSQQVITSTLNNTTDGYAWTTPITPSTSMQVRVESVVSPTTVFAVSGLFTLTASVPPTPTTPKITLIAPTASTRWPVNSAQQIEWKKTDDISDVNVYYSIAGVTTTLVTSATGTSYAWTTPPTPTTKARVRVESVISPTEVFAISPLFELYTSTSDGTAVYLPLILQNYGITPPTGELVQPQDFEYMGAFRLPGNDPRPKTFEYGGNAMTFNPDGPPAQTGYGSGSLFIMGHDRLAYGEMPDGNQVAELRIPTPVNSRNLEDLNYAEFIQDFTDVMPGFFMSYEDIVRVGMAYLNHPDTGPKIHLGFGWHLPPENPVATHGWFNADLTNPNFQGTWYIGNQSFDSVNGYLFDIPAAWADTHTGSRYVATGRYRDGGWSGMGPALFAYRPWQTGGSAPVSGTHLAETVLLRYESSRNTGDIVHALNNYQHADEWEGGDWLTTPSGKSAVLFAGTKGTGAKYWYGWVHPDGPQYPCIEVEFVNDFTTCRLADNTPCPAEDLTGCEGHNDDRGWWSTRFDAQIILYDPADLAEVAAGTMESWEPQPYAAIDIDEHLYLDPPEGDLDNLGRGDQRRMRIGAVAYDRNSGTLYVLEQFADGGKPVVHVWRVR